MAHVPSNTEKDKSNHAEYRADKSKFLKKQDADKTQKSPGKGGR